MDYSTILSELNNASLFELFRLGAAIDAELQNPARLDALRRRLKVGQEFTYFEVRENRLVEAVITQIKSNRVLVRRKDDGQIWDMPFHNLNIDAAPTDIDPGSRKKLDRQQLKVGDKVAFKDRDGRELLGEVVKLNPKNAKVQVGLINWRVGYDWLMPVIDGEVKGDLNLLEGEVVDREEV